MGGSSRTNLPFSNVSGAALMQNVAPENWFQRMNTMIGVDESLCQEGHDDSNSQPCEKLSLAACTACALHGVGGCLAPDESQAHWHMGHEPKCCARDAGGRMCAIVHDLLGPFWSVQVDGQEHVRDDDRTLRVWHFLSILLVLLACYSV